MARPLHPLIAFGLLCAAALPAARAEHPYDFVNDYRSADDRLCRGWRLTDERMNEGDPLLLKLDHHGFKPEQRRRILLLPGQGWRLELDMNRATLLPFDAAELLELLNPRRVFVAARAGGGADLFGDGRWLSRGYYSSLTHSGAYYAFSQGDEVGLLDARGVEVVRLRAHAVRPLADDLAAVDTGNAEGVWSIGRARWLLEPGPQDIVEKAGRIEVVRPSGIAVFDRERERLGDTVYSRMISLGDGGLALARSSAGLSVLDARGRVLWRPSLDEDAHATAGSLRWRTDWGDGSGGRALEREPASDGSGSAPSARVEEQAAAQRIPDASATLGNVVGADGEIVAEARAVSEAETGLIDDTTDWAPRPVVHLPGHLLIRQARRWILVRQRDATPVAEFDTVVIPPSRADAGVFWARRGQTQGYFNSDGRLLQADPLEPPADFEFPAWSVRPSPDGWLLYEGNSAVRRFARRRYEEDQADYRADNGFQPDLTLIGASGERWVPCRVEERWREERACRTDWDRRTARDAMPDPLLEAGLSYIEREPGRIRLAFGNGRVTAAHRSCYAAGPVLACESESARYDYRSLASAPYQHRGRGERFTVYRLEDGQILNPPGEMMAGPLVSTEYAWMELKSTTDLQQWQNGKLLYRLHCDGGEPVLLDGDGATLWRWHPRQPGLGGRVPPELRMRLGEFGF